MEYTVTEGPAGVIALPSELLESLGRPETLEAELTAQQPELYLRPVTGRLGTVAERLEAIDRARAAMPRGVGFATDEWEALMADRKAAANARDEKVLGWLGADDLPA